MNVSAEMKFNLFEGFRRVGYVILVLLIAFSFYMFFSSSDRTVLSTVDAIAFPVGFYIFMRVTGWVMRGFLGIPMGKDFKE